MNKILYGIVGIVIGCSFCLFFILNIPNSTYLVVNNSSEIDSVEKQENNKNVTFDKKNIYQLDKNNLKAYEESKVITYGKKNPMAYLKKEIINDTLGEVKNNTESNNTVDELKDNQNVNTEIKNEETTEDIEDIEDIEVVEIPESEEYTEIETTENDKTQEDLKTENKPIDENIEIKEIDWTEYDKNYIAPKGYSLGYNTKTKKLKLMNIEDIFSEIKENGVLPVDKKLYGISSIFGIRKNPFNKKTKEFHYAIDIANKDIYKSKIYSILDGTITKKTEANGYGKYIVIKHDNFSTLYAHLDSFNENIKVGDKVKVGDVVGYVGISGEVTGANMHLEFIRNGIRFNPKQFLDLLFKK